MRQRKRDGLRSMTPQNLCNSPLHKLLIAISSGGTGQKCRNRRRRGRRGGQPFVAYNPIKMAERPGKSGTTSTNASIPANDENVKGKFSPKNASAFDSTDRELSEQQEYFKGSKVRDGDALYMDKKPAAAASPAL